MSHSLVPAAGCDEPSRAACVAQKPTPFELPPERYHVHQYLDDIRAARAARQRVERDEQLRRAAGWGAAAVAAAALLCWLCCRARKPAALHRA